ncbi:MAG: Smr/MutS family protein [Clostridia bacterium]|nr:Smr/MutS family protein [Clostridia bacterium]
MVEKISNKKIYLRYENTVITTDIGNIEFVPENEVTKKKSTYSITLETPEIPNEIMLRHKLKETAIAELDKYIDQAVLNNLGRVRIIHGKHGGVLREAVHEYLASHPYVKDFSIADYSEGGLGVTVAILGKNVKTQNTKIK